MWRGEGAQARRGKGDNLLMGRPVGRLKLIVLNGGASCVWFNPSEGGGSVLNAKNRPKTVFCQKSGILRFFFQKNELHC